MANEKYSKENVAEIKQKAEAGDPQAQYEYALCYLNGKTSGLGCDYAQAFRWFYRAAQQGHAAAQGWVGDFYYHGGQGQDSGGGVKQDLGKAFEWTKKAAEQGEFLQRLGNLYENGEGCAADDYKAADCYIQAFLQDPSYFSPVRDLLRLLAKRGAQFENDLASKYEEFPLIKAFGLGESYYSGRGGYPCDKAKAVEQYTKAANLGHAYSQYALGEFYFIGDCGLTIDKKTARQWWRKAAKQGDPKAIRALQTGDDF